MAERLSAAEVEQQALRIEAAHAAPDDLRFEVVTDDKGANRMARLTAPQIAARKAEQAARRAAIEGERQAAKAAEDAAFEARVAAAVEAALAKREGR